MCKKVIILVSFILVLGLTVSTRADLEGYWAFDEGSGSTAFDGSGNNRDGTISGATWQAGGWDGTAWCLDFDGNDDLVELGAFDVAGSGITLAVWFRPDDFDVYGSRLISKANEYDDNAHWWMLSAFATAGGERLRYRLKTTDGQRTTTLIASSGTLVTGQWQHAAATWDGAMMRLYLDAIEVGSVAKGGSAVATDPSVSVAIGSQPSDAYLTDPSHKDKFFDGLIDDVRIYNIALSASEIQDLVSGITPPPVPPNDECINAQVVGDVTNLPFDTTLATFDGPGYCMTSNNIWYLYTATCTGDVTVSLCGSSFDTKLAVYSGGSCYPTAGNMIGCNDDACGQQSELTFAATAGGLYLIEVGGYGTASGQGVLTISCSAGPPPPVPPNDDCVNAQVVGDVTNLPFDTTLATFDGPGLCMTSNNIWYLYTATCTGDVTVSLCGSTFDTKLAVYSGGSCYPTAGKMVGCDDDTCGQQSELTFAATAGGLYLIEVGGYGSYSGQGVLSISCSAPPPPVPPNDDCVNAQVVGDVTNLPFDTTLATFDGPGLCMTSNNIWYLYTATCTGNVTVSLCGSTFDTKLAVYSGGSCYPAAGNMIGCDDDTCGQQSELTFAATAGSLYLIEVGGYGSYSGQGVLSISCSGPPPPPPVPNDNCYNAQPVSDATVLTFDTTLATFDGPGYYITGANIWYCYTATCTGQATVSLCGSSYDTKLVVYDGCGCYPSLGDMIQYNDDFCGHQSEVTFDVTAGGQYLFEVGGYGSAKGQGVLSINCEAVIVAESDLGDAPDSTNNYGVAMTAYPKGGPMGVQAGYPTVYDDGSGVGPYGPIHLNPLAVAHLGNNVTLEAEADVGPDQDVSNNITPTTNASGKDGADDGVIFPFNMPHCKWTTFDYTVKVITPNTDLWVNVWCDWNRDGDWNDDSSTNPALNCAGGVVSEWAVQNQYLFNLSAGSHQITTKPFLSWHPQYGSKQIWMRITLSEQPWKGGTGPKKPIGGSGPQAGYEYGETEDYYFLPDMSYSICEDFNGDGVINMQDLSAFTAKWLEDCQ